VPIDPDGLPGAINALKKLSEATDFLRKNICTGCLAAGMSSQLVHGIVAPGFESIRSAFATAQSLDPGGAQLAVYQHGVKVVDLWTGDDVVRHKALPQDGLICFMSTTKALTATVAHLLVQRGQLDIDAPIAKYWPEFGKNGKETITTRMVLSHSAGLAVLPSADNMQLSDLPHWEKIIHCLEEMPPFWQPGTAFFYHMLNFGYIIGEIVRRITGRTIGTFFHEEVALPFGLDLFIGLPEAFESRVVPWMQKTPLRPAPGTTLAEMPAPSPGTANLSFDSTQFPLAGEFGRMIRIMRDQNQLPPFINSRDAHACEIPGMNGIGDARSLAKLFAALIGPIEGHERLLSEATIRAAVAPQTDNIGPPPPFNQMPSKNPMRFALGFEIHRWGNPMLSSSSFGHPGAGGRLVFADLDSGICVGYVCNNPVWEIDLGPDVRWTPWLDALREIVQKK